MCCGWSGLCLTEFVQRGKIWGPLSATPAPSPAAFLCVLPQSPLQPKSQRISDSIALFSAFILRSSTQKPLCHLVLFLFSQNGLFGLLRFASLCFFVLFCGLNSSGCWEAFTNEQRFLSPSLSPSLSLSEFSYVEQQSPAPSNSSIVQDVSRWTPGSVWSLAALTHDLFKCSVGF